MAIMELKNFHAITLALMSCFFVCCSQKQHKTLSAPYPTTTKKIFDTSSILIEQGNITDRDLIKSLGEVSQEIVGIGVKIKNKTKKPITVEIERTNIGTYDAEDMALMTSKIALQHPRVKELVVGHQISKALTLGISGGLAVATAYTAFRELKKEQTRNPSAKPLNDWLLGAISVIATTPIILAASYVYNAIKSDEADILECEEERLIEQCRQIFEPATLAFDDTVEIAPQSSLDIAIFYNPKMRSNEHHEQKILVLRCVEESTKHLIPLEL